MKKVLAPFLFVLAATHAFSTVTIYNNDFNWLGAGHQQGLTPFFELFAGPTITAPGLSVKSVSGPFGAFRGDGYIANHMWNDCVGNCGLIDYDATFWSFSQPAYGFGGQWNVDPNGLALVLERSDGVSDVVFVPPGSSFVGFLSADPFTSIYVAPEGLIPRDISTTYTMSALLFSTAASTPEPNTLWLALVAIPIGFWFRHRRIRR